MCEMSQSFFITVFMKIKHLKDNSTPNWTFSLYLLIPMLLRSQVKFLISKNISVAAPEQLKQLDLNVCSFLKNQFDILDYVKQAVWFYRFEMMPRLLQLFWRNLQGWFSGNQTMTESSLLSDPFTNWLAVITAVSNWCGVVVLLFLTATVSRDESFSRIASKTSWSRCIIEPWLFLSQKPSLMFADDVRSLFEPRAQYAPFIHPFCFPCLDSPRTCPRTRSISALWRGRGSCPTWSLMKRFCRTCLTCLPGWLSLGFTVTKLPSGYVADSSNLICLGVRVY